MIDNVGEYFEDALSEEGFTDADVTTADNPAKMHTEVIIRVDINGETYTHRQTLTDRALLNANDPKQHVAMVANNVASEFADNASHMATWGDSHVLIDERGDTSATCMLCGTEVTLDDMPTTNRAIAEAATPNPPVDVSNLLTAHKTEMVLLAILRDTCDGFCANSATENNIYRKI